MGNIKVVHRSELRLPDEVHSVRLRSRPETVTLYREMLMDARQQGGKWPFATPLIVREAVRKITTVKNKDGQPEIGRAHV